MHKVSVSGQYFLRKTASKQSFSISVSSHTEVHKDMVGMVLLLSAWESSGTVTAEETTNKIHDLVFEHSHMLYFLYLTLILDQNLVCHLYRKVSIPCQAVAGCLAELENNADCAAIDAKHQMYYAVVICLFILCCPKLIKYILF